MQQNQLNHQRTRSAFRSIALNQKDYVTYRVLHDAVSSLSHQQFDQDIMQQLWEECRLNSKGQIKIDAFIDTIIRAEAILIQKQKEIDNAIYIMEKKINNPGLAIDQKDRHRDELVELQQLKNGFAMDLAVLRKPFMNFTMDTIYPRNNLEESIEDNRIRNSEMEQTAFIPISNKKNLTWIAYLTMVMIGLQLLAALNITVFTNLVLFFLIFSMYMFEHFDRSTIRLLFWADIYTLVIDVLWYCLVAPNLWNLPQNGLWPKFMSGYLKFSVILISLVFIGKLLLGMLLCSEYNIDESKSQQVKIFTHTFVLSSKNKQAPIKQSIAQYFPKQQNEAQNSREPVQYSSHL